MELFGKKQVQLEFVSPKGIFGQSSFCIAYRQKRGVKTVAARLDERNKLQFEADSLATLTLLVDSASKKKAGAALDKKNNVRVKHLFPDGVLMRQAPVNFQREVEEIKFYVYLGVHEIYNHAKVQTLKVKLRTIDPSQHSTVSISGIDYMLAGATNLKTMDPGEIDMVTFTFKNPLLTMDKFWVHYTFKDNEENVNAHAIGRLEMIEAPYDGWRWVIEFKIDVQVKVTSCGDRRRMTQGTECAEEGEENTKYKAVVIILLIVALLAVAGVVAVILWLRHKRQISDDSIYYVDSAIEMQNADTTARQMTQLCLPAN